MPFEMINTCATYLRMIKKLFAEMIDDTMIAYVDVMMVKLIKSVDRVEDPWKTFERMHAP